MYYKEDYAQSYADYKGLNPIINWRINEIQEILNSTRGYEDIKIVFEFFENYEYKNTTFVCRIKLVDGNKILLRYEWIIENRDKEEASVIAWNEATKILMRDIWLTAIDSFKNLSYAK
jgi:hypothetical protein